MYLVHFTVLRMYFFSCLSWHEIPDQVRDDVLNDILFLVFRLFTPSRLKPYSPLKMGRKERFEFTFAHNFGLLTSNVYLSSSLPFTGVFVSCFLPNSGSGIESAAVRRHFLHLHFFKFILVLSCFPRNYLKLIQVKTLYPLVLRPSP